MNRNVVGAHYGLMDWLAQRITGIVMAVYHVDRVCRDARRCHVLARSLAGLHGQRADPLPQLPLHSQSLLPRLGRGQGHLDGLRQAASVRVILHVLTLLALVGYAGWAVQIIWRL
jgi:succinate dehydrogenase / fumarate reductase membrane anchor subunit